MYVTCGVFQDRQQSRQAEVGHLVHLGVNQNLKRPRQRIQRTANTKLAKRKREKNLFKACSVTRISKS